MLRAWRIFRADPSVSSRPARHAMMGEMGGCTAEADHPELEPETQRFPEGRPLRRSGFGSLI